MVALVIRESLMLTTALSLGATVSKANYTVRNAHLVVFIKLMISTVIYRTPSKSISAILAID